jgi:hypothetical protein
MTGLDDQDRELEDFLARRSVLHRRLADRDYHEPPQELDRLVLDKAREAIEVRPAAPMYRAPRWALPVALAATVVLALAVVMNFARMHAGRGGYPVAASASPAAEAAPGFGEREALPIAPAAPATELANQGVQSSDTQVRVDSADADSREFASAPRLASAPTEADRAKDHLLASNAPSAQQATAAIRETAPVVERVAAAKAPAPSAVQMPAKVHAASEPAAVGATAGSAPASPPPVASSSARFARAEATSEGRIVPAREAALKQADAEADDGSLKREGKASPNPAAASDTFAAAAAPAVPMLSDKAKRADPRAWLHEIEQLRIAGKSADADRELAEFRKVFPNESVPQSAIGRDPRPIK